MSESRFGNGAALGERPVGAILRDIATRGERLIRGEIQLAAAEIGREIADLSRGLLTIGAAAAFVLLGAGFALLGLSHLLALAMPSWLAELLAGAAAGIAAVLLIARIGRPGGGPPREEDPTWARR